MVLCYLSHSGWREKGAKWYSATSTSVVRGIRVPDGTLPPLPRLLEGEGCQMILCHLSLGCWREKGPRCSSATFPSLSWRKKGVRWYSATCPSMGLSKKGTRWSSATSPSMGLRKKGTRWSSATSPTVVGWRRVPDGPLLPLPQWLEGEGCQMVLCHLPLVG